MEYGVIANGGHVLIYGSNQLIGWETNNYNIYVPKSDYTGTPETTGSTGLFRTINQMNNNGSNVFASFAHPDFADYNDLANVAYNPLADSAVLGCAVASGPAFSQSTSYNDAPASMAYIDYYNKMLSKGYHIGPFMDHDTHYTNFGRSSNNRLAVTAPSLTSNNFYAAIKSRDFYATEDCDTRVTLTLNNEKMGSINTGTIAPAISVYAVDPTSPTSIPTIKIMYGILGSGILPVQVANATGYTVSYTDNNLAIGATGYYYADIYIAGNRTITAPIWYTKTAVTPVKLLSFNAFVNNNRTVQLQWKTTNEIDNKMFVVEKSLTGNQYVVLQNVAAKNDNATINNYSIIDENPSEGINYYRLKQVDKNGKYAYSNVVAINLKVSNSNAFSLQQNPISDILKLNINSTNTAKATIYITDIFGRILNTQIIHLAKGFQTSSINLAGLKNGNYQVSLVLDNEMITQKFVKL